MIAHAGGYRPSFETAFSNVGTECEQFRNFSWTSLSKWCKITQMEIRAPACLRVEVRTARAALDWSADELAVAARVGRNTIARIEAGCPVRAETARRVLRALAEAGVRIDGAAKDTVTVSVVVSEHDPAPDGFHP